MGHGAAQFCLAPLKFSFALKATACTHKTRGFSVKAGAGEEKAVKVTCVENIGQWKRSVRNVKSVENFSEINSNSKNHINMELEEHLGSEVKRFESTHEEHLFHTIQCTPVLFSPCAL